MKNLKKLTGSAMVALLLLAGVAHADGQHPFDAPLGEDKKVSPFEELTIEFKDGDRHMLLRVARDGKVHYEGNLDPSGTDRIVDAEVSPAVAAFLAEKYENAADLSKLSTQPLTADPANKFHWTLKAGGETRYDATKGPSDGLGVPAMGRFFDDFLTGLFASIPDANRAVENVSPSPGPPKAEGQQAPGPSSQPQSLGLAKALDRVKEAGSPGQNRAPVATVLKPAAQAAETASWPPGKKGEVRRLADGQGRKWNGFAWVSY